MTELFKRIVQGEKQREIVPPNRRTYITYIEQQEADRKSREQADNYYLRIRRGKPAGRGRLFT
jgi:hypothetical protein